MIARAYGDQERLREAWASGDRERVAAAVREVAARLIEFEALPPGLDRDDLVQEATIAALARIEAGYDASRGSLRTFTYGSFRFTIKDRARQERRRAARFVPLAAEAR